MTLLFQAAADWLSDQLKVAGATRVITIRNESLEPSIEFEVDATPGDSQWEEDGREAVTRIASRDFLVDVRDMIFDDKRTMPQRGWIIIDSLEGSTYEVFAPDGEAPWDWCDTSHRRIRIHTQALDRNQ